MFDSNYLIHFVVADASDTYYAAGGLPLTLRQKLLLEAESDEVFFLQDDEQFPQLYDRSGSLVEEFSKKAGLGKSRNEVCRTRLAKLLKESKAGRKTTVVAELPAFCRLMGDAGSLQKSGSNPGTLILLIPQNADAALPWLLDPDGPFLRDKKNPCCPQIVYLHQQKEELFCNLKDCDQFHFYSELTEETCKNILLCALLEQKDIYPTQTAISDGAVFLHRLCSSRALRKQTKLMEQLGEMPRFAELYQWVSTGGNLERLFSLLTELKADSLSIYDALAEFEPRHIQLIRRTDPLVKDICGITYPPSWCKTPNLDLEQQLLQVQQYLFFPRTAKANEQMKLWLQQLLQEYRDGLKLKSPQHLHNALQALCFVGRQIYTTDQEAAHLLQLQDALRLWLELSEKVLVESQKLEKMEALLQTSPTVSLHHQVEEQKIAMANWQQFYDTASAAVVPMLNQSQDISLQQAKDILEKLKTISPPKEPAVQAKAPAAPEQKPQKTAEPVPPEKIKAPEPQEKPAAFAQDHPSKAPPPEPPKPALSDEELKEKQRLRREQLKQDRFKNFV